MTKTVKRACMAIISMLKWEKKIPILEIKNDKLFSNKVALITGGSGGIGMAIAKHLLQDGCKVIIAGTNEDKLVCAKQELGAHDFIVLDMNDIESFDKKIKELFIKNGGIDIFICSAGVHSENIDFWQMTEKEYDRVMNVNLKGTYFFCQTAAKYIKEHKGGGGNILLVSSSRGSEPAWSPYGISKWALNGMTKGLAKELAPYGINVNAIAPGSTATNLLGYKKGESIYCEDNSVHRLSMPEEVANLAGLLVSDAGKMINGEIIHISAGRGTFDIR